ncbi:hypothetical protein BWI17_14800 [Betaproteobacteria bacterium GR16-43]|nr:hypothetical protein BWI17_14800 [Betaproteobacteria bacterium GR16-43]
MLRLLFPLLLLACTSAGAASLAKPSRYAPAPVAVCPGVLADATGTTGASRALQQCLDTTPSPWTIPPGVYALDAALTIRRPIAVYAHGATFKAQRDIIGTFGGHTMVFSGYMSGVRLTGLTLDGNLPERAGAWFCNGTNDAYAGGNIHFDHVDDVVLDGVTTRDAVCGSGMHFSGKRARIVNSVFERNGTHRSNQWADGLTLLNCDDCTVTGNRFTDNSDVGLVFGGGERTLVADNLFEQATPIFAALALDNFNGSQSGSFVGTVVTRNTIDCRNLQCDFGMNLGPRAWYLSANIRGGTVQGNTITGAKIGVLAGGAGTPADPMMLQDNTVVSLMAPGTMASFSCGFRSTFPRITSPSSVIQVPKDAPGVSTVHELCP